MIYYFTLPDMVLQNACSEWTTKGYIYFKNMERIMTVSFTYCNTSPCEGGWHYEHQKNKMCIVN